MLSKTIGPEWDSSDDEEAVIKSKDEKKENNKITNKSTKDGGSKKTKKKKDNNKDNNSNPKNKENNNNNNEDDSNESSRVIYIGHIPPAFEELQLLKFFSQFGKITNIKLSRARRTGNSRGYAFLQFDDKEVASIVADTMGGYFLMGERRLVCHVVPKSKIHPKLFQGSKRNLQLCQNDVSCSKRIQYWQDKEREVVNKKERSMDGIKKITKRLLSREKKKREQLKALGIDYDFPGYQASLEQTVALAEAVTTGEKDDNKKDQKSNDEKKKKRKVSVDEGNEERSDSKVNSTKKVKKTLTPTKESVSSATKKTRKVSQDIDDVDLGVHNNKTTQVTPQNKPETKKISTTETNKKKKSKKRRKSARGV